MIGDILPPLLMTLALELPIALLWGLRGKNLALCAVLNLLTNPLVNLIRLFLPMLWLVPVLECAVIIAEGLLYRALGDGIRRPFCLSLTANLVSALLGTFLLFLVAAQFWRWF